MIYVLQISPESSLSLFADDMALYRTIHSIDDYFTLQSDVSSLSSWIRSISLSLFSQLSAVPRKHSHAIAPPTLLVEGVPLPFVTFVKVVP